MVLVTVSLTPLIARAYQRATRTTSSTAPSAAARHSVMSPGNCTPDGGTSLVTELEACCQMLAELAGTSIENTWLDDSLSHETPNDNVQMLAELVGTSIGNTWLDDNLSYETPSKRLVRH